MTQTKILPQGVKDESAYRSHGSCKSDAAASIQKNRTRRL